MSRSPSTTSSCINFLLACMGLHSFHRIRAMSGVVGGLPGLAAGCISGRSQWRGSTEGALRGSMRHRRPGRTTPSGKQPLTASKCRDSTTTQLSHVSDSSKTKRSIAQQAPRKGQVFESTPLAINMPESPKDS